ncbi:AbrB family transcriptional regulator [Quadrisphaera setariae]|nr:AbrB family transcriptional regulator [Quadrisphaera setariae]
MAWLVVAAATAALAAGMTRLGVPSAALFAAVLAGLVVALTGWPRTRWRRGERLELATPVSKGAQAVLGVLSGALLQPATLAELAGSWAPVLAAVVATLLVSVLAGLLLGLRRDVDAATGSFAMVAGGASGLTAIAGELGADQRVVAVVQYLRVLLILLAMPVVAVLLGGGSSGAPPGGAGSGSGGGLTASAAPWWVDVLFTAVVAAVGIWLARLAKLPAAPLLGPMVVAAAVSATGLTQGATVPGPVLQVAFALIGLQVGLSFTRSNLKTVGRVLPAALALIVLVIGATAAVGVPLLRLAGASTLDAYLATTPGGLYAVVATSADSGGDTTLVLAVQVLRLLVMLLLAPLIGAALGRGGRRRRRRPGR